MSSEQCHFQRRPSFLGPVCARANLKSEEVNAAPTPMPPSAANLEYCARVHLQNLHNR